MLRFLGAVFISILLASGVLLLDHYSNSGFVVEFARGQSSLIMATALAINIATITFLVGNLLGIEEKVGKDGFGKTRSELKQNVIAMAIIFVLNTVVIALISTHRSSTGLWSLNNILGTTSLALLFTFGALVLETSMLVLRIKAHSPKN